MSLWVLLLRGINVGGTGKLPMKDLKAHLEALGAEAPETYIQSGNAVFAGDIDPSTFATELTQIIQTHHGHAPRVLILPAEAVLAARAAYPFPAGLERPKFANIWFCAETPSAPDLARLEDAATATERFALEERWFFLDARTGSDAPSSPNGWKRRWVFRRPPATSTRCTSCARWSRPGRDRSGDLARLAHLAKAGSRQRRLFLTIWSR